MKEFIQQGPILGNPFADDPLLQAFLRWRLPADLQETLAPGLLGFGARVLDEVQELGPQAESIPPSTAPLDAWATPIVRMEVGGPGTLRQNIPAAEGRAASGSGRAGGAYSRLHQFCRLYMSHPAAAWFTSPLAMTDGAA